MIKYSINCSRCGFEFLNIDLEANPKVNFHIGNHICKSRIDYILSKNKNLVYFDLGNDMKLIDFEDLEYEKGSWCYRIKNFDPTYISNEDIVEIKSWKILNIIDCSEFWKGIDDKNENN